jgi:hypothetical protein
MHTHAKDVICASCQSDNWATRTLCRSCGHAMQFRWNSNAAEFAPAKLAAGSADFPGLHELNAQFVLFASGTSNVLASINDALVQLGQCVASASGLAGAVGHNTCAEGAVSLAFVNDLLDSIGFADVVVTPAGDASVRDSSAIGASANGANDLLQGMVQPLPKTADGSMIDLVVDQVMWIHGLVSRPELNGAQGVIISLPDSASDRYAVRVLASSLFGRSEVHIRLKRDNLRLGLFS